MLFSYSVILLLLSQKILTALRIPVNSNNVKIKRLSPLPMQFINTVSTKKEHDKTSLAETKYDFHYLKSFESRISRLSNSESDWLLLFWSKNLRCFQIYPDMVTSRVSITTTCMVIASILKNPTHWNGKCRWDSLQGGTSYDQYNIPSEISLQEVITSLNNAPWSGDAFQTPLLIRTLCTLKSIDKNNVKYCVAIENLLEQRAKVSLHRVQSHSAYLRYQNVLALHAVIESGLIPDVLRGTNRIGYALERANMVAFDELCRQLAFYNAGDSGNFDVIVLTYSLLAYWETSQSSWMSSFARGVLAGANMNLVESALAIIFACQASDGTWRKGEPISSKGATQSDRDIGNNYVFFFDIIDSLVSSIGSFQPELLLPYLKNIERYRYQIMP